MHKNNWFKKKATLVRSEKVEIIPTVRRNRIFQESISKQDFYACARAKKSDVAAVLGKLLPGKFPIG